MIYLLLIGGALAFPVLLGWLDERYEPANTAIPGGIFTVFLVVAWVVILVTALT